MDKQHSLYEAIADIAYMAGFANYYGGDSRADIQTFIQLAKEFEAQNEGIEWGVDKEYIETIEAFVKLKLNN